MIDQRVKGRDRNRLCWCGSGKKFKKCHLGRHEQQKDNPWVAVGIQRREFSKKQCFAHDVGLGPCKGKIIKAHTISRGPNLSRISENGHVTCYKTSIDNLIKNKGELSVSEVGVKEASTFSGFCQKHDREIFSCIENEQFSGRPDQCLASAYRTLCRELYGKNASSHLRETLRGADKGASFHQQRNLQHSLDLINKGIEASKRELRATYDQLTSALANKNNDLIGSLVIEFDGILPFMFAGAWSPFTDLHGKELQKGYSDELLEQIFVSSFATESSSFVCVSWLNVGTIPTKVIADQIAELPAELKASACLQLVTKHVENIYFKSSWFNNLGERQRRLLDKLARDGADPMGSIPSSPIKLDVDFQLPSSSRVFFS